MRRGVGIGAIQKNKETQNKFREKGSELASEELTLLSTHVANFRQGLEDFATKHRNEVKKNPQFRRQFQEMCASIGVDPLASSKGFWSETLGVGDFYYELGVQIIEVCISTSHLNGGIITLEELRERLLRSRSKTRKESISSDDILRAVAKLKALGNGFSVVQLSNGKLVVQSVPGELNMDYARVLQHAEECGRITPSHLISAFNWSSERAEQILTHLVQEGLCWVDTQDTEVSYWFPGLFKRS